MTDLHVLATEQRLTDQDLVASFETVVLALPELDQLDFQTRAVLAGSIAQMENAKQKRIFNLLELAAHRRDQAVKERLLTMATELLGVA
ncbi:hypothetical protein ACFVAJ_19300 [Agromyces sp. NPDC057679]|uniref:hypothetical protein n=1 Tax=Agromyces sp. NPDC057679 TaxID=3346207 RepID=UPI00366BBD9C